ncbi:MAG: hypothetical protein PHH08_01220 [Candidatus ainarchaeum sp.]|nr:hypothetical protein [Candidatus ainarchaeum sp.]
MDFVRGACESRGLSARQRKDMPPQEAKARTIYTRAHSKMPIYRLEITYGLKKAFPEKEKRRNWPRTN